MSEQPQSHLELQQAPALCRSCGQPIHWAVFRESRKRNPVDAAPVPNGNLVLSLERASGAFVIDTFHPEKHQGRNRYQSHFSSCAQAKDWRKP